MKTDNTAAMDVMDITHLLESFNRLTGHVLYSATISNEADPDKHEGLVGTNEEVNVNLIQCVDKTPDL